MSDERTRSITDHLSEHIPYSLLMLRYALYCLRAPRSQLDWNAHYECFAVHARLLAVFLTDDSDQTTFRISDLTTGYSVVTQLKVFHKLNEQVLHFNSRRTKDAKDKIDGTEVARMASWIERAFSDFEKALRAEYRPFLRMDIADPTNLIEQGVSLGPNRTTTTTTETRGIFTP